MEIENRNTLIAYLKSGVNLFTGAAFSIMAKDDSGAFLPTGKQLLQELHAHIGNGPNDLPRYCTVMERTNRQKLHDYLTRRFHVSWFDPCYENLNLINIKSIFTTNIDDLIPQIIHKDPTRYINDQRVNGEFMDSKAVNYLPLHGNVDTPEKGYIFTTAEIANTFHDNGRSWQYLMQSIEKCPTIFLGYSISDTSTIQALTSSQTFDNAKKDMWILLYKPEEEDIAYFKALGFNIIIGSIDEFIKGIRDLLGTPKKINNVKTNAVTTLLKANFIPKDDRNQTKRPIEEFLRGMPPLWSDILRNVIYKTSHYREIQDSVFNPHRHTIVVGAPVSGKTTLAMQVGHFIDYAGYKLFLQDLSLNRAEYISKIIGKEKALIIVDNFTDSEKAFLCLTKCPNVKLVGVDRTVNFGNVSHKFPTDKFDIINVTELTDEDIQGVYESLPREIRKDEILHRKYRRNDVESIYEFVVQNITKESITTRYEQFMRNLDKDDFDVAQFLVLCAYMNRCRVPLTMDVAYSFFYDLGYGDVIKIRKKLNDLLREDISEELIESGIEGYRPRSYHIAEAILRFSSREMLSDVYWNFINEVSKLKVCNYGIFKRWAFDKELMLKAFPKWEDGEKFYKEAFLYDDKNPYVLQQGALYLSDKRQYGKAFAWIDKAIMMTDNKQFSIRNSHAIILFDSNYEIDTPDAITQLNKSMKILQHCFHDDKRRLFHALTYAKQAIRYFKRLPQSPKSMEYLKQARDWLDSEQDDKPWNYEVKALLRRVDDIIKVEEKEGSSL